jgi:uncharacterized protein
MPDTDHPLITFRSSEIHGMGGFAQSAIREGTRLIEYRGQKITKDESLRRCEQNNEFIFTLDDIFDLDGNVGWNPAKFINHSCEPNCEANIIDEQIWILALRDIPRGEEISFNYGYDREDFEEHPCRCGAPGCLGFIVAEEFFDDIRAQSRKPAVPV